MLKRTASLFLVSGESQFSTAEVSSLTTSTENTGRERRKEGESPVSAGRTFKRKMDELN